MVDIFNLCLDGVLRYMHVSVCVYILYKSKNLLACSVDDEEKEVSGGDFGLVGLESMQ